VAATLYGDDGERLVSEWLDIQLGFVGDAEFAAIFADHINLPGIASLDYAHRQLRTQHGELLGGIRFYGRDLARPFIDVLAHSFTDLSALAEVVAAEWSAFGVRFMRLQHRPGILNGDNVILDQTIHVARYNQMTPPDGRVRLTSRPDRGGGEPGRHPRLRHQLQRRLGVGDRVVTALIQTAPEEDERLRLAVAGSGFPISTAS
jgi:hypothetical protein